MEYQEYIRNQEEQKGYEFALVNQAMSFAGFLSFNNYPHITADRLRRQTGLMCKKNSAYVICCKVIVC